MPRSRAGARPRNHWSDMDYNLILNIGNSRVYQGAAPDDQITSLDNPNELMLVEMASGIDALHWVRQGDLCSVIYFGIDDVPTGCLTDGVLLSLAASCSAWIDSGNDVLFGCGAGISRSSYGDCATLMHTLGCSFDDALTLIRKSRPQANPNSGFVDQLKRLEAKLRSRLMS